MTRSVIISSVLHAVFIFLTAMSLPFLTKKPIDLPPIVSIELIQITDKTNIPFAPKAKKIIAKINALYPFPGSWFKHNGNRVKITKAQEIDLQGKPGEILNKNFTIACQENAIEVLELQKEGKKKMKTSEYLKGNKLEIGSNIGKNL